MTTSLLENHQIINPNKILLKLQYKSLDSKTEDKFEEWIMEIEDCWTEEIAACLQGNFPDWRGE
jgi:hypothetical protein